MPRDTRDTWVGRTVVDEAGDKIGKVQDIYVDETTGEPEWLAIKTGLFGGKASFAPLAGASERGEDVVLPYPKDVVKDAPNIDDDGRLSPEEEERLYSHYQRDYRREAPTAKQSGGDDAMTRSEEQLRVGTTSEETGRARLRKYVVTEMVQTTVPVSHEEVHIEREPITDANRDQALSGPDITETEHEVVLHAERPVVEKEVVPIERVRLQKDVVTGEAQVSEEVRKEKIDTSDVEGR